MLHPKEKARRAAIERHDAIDRERLDAQAKGLPFTKWNELREASDAIRTATSGIRNVVECERCGVDVDLDDPDALVFHVTGAVQKLRVGVGVDIRHFQVPGREGYPVTPYGVVVALRPPEQDEIARCPDCAEHLLGYIGRGSAPADAGAKPAKK